MYYSEPDMINGKATLRSDLLVHYCIVEYVRDDGSTLFVLSVDKK